ncbi:hypothetical protein Mpsy_0064 [Methanolobus psychrophilus R15]|nr:hypothetical protein Mpsy_0064 [Methanolobus psychrophilus R15]
MCKMLYNMLKGIDSSSIIRRSFLIIVVLMLLTSCVSARDYTLDHATANITVDADGITHVEESITYSFDGIYYEVFRTVYPPPGGSVENITGYCIGGQCDFRVVPVSGGYELVGSLPQPTPEQITFVVSYDYYRGVKVYNDVSELHYQLWGDEWEKSLNGFTVTVTLPAGSQEDNILYWIYPDHYTRSSYLEGNTIVAESDEIPSGSWYEIRAVFPRLQSPNPTFVSIQNQDGLEEILAVERAYDRKAAMSVYLFYMAALYVLLVLLFPFYIYHKYGREPDIDYYGLYERELPTDSKPAVVNAIMRGKIGIPTIEGFTATVMDLVDREYLRLKDTTSTKKHLGLISREKEDVLIEINMSADKKKLLNYEKDVFDLLSSYASEGKVLWSDLKKELGKGTAFYHFLNRWNDKVTNHAKVDKLFESKGNKYMAVFSIAVIIIAFLSIWFVAFLFPTNEFPVMKNFIILVMAAGVIAIVMLIIVGVSERTMGQWTPEGRLFHKRWDNFRKYLTDFSALKEHPPESIKIWDHYMVYAVALGVAEKALDNMSLIIPSEQLSGSRFYPVHHNMVFISGFRSAYQASTPGSSPGGSSGVGGAGGGFGGGGGGAR